MAAGSPIGLLLSLTQASGSPPGSSSGLTGLAIGIGIGVAYPQAGGGSSPPGVHGTPVGLLIAITKP